MKSRLAVLTVQAIDIVLVFLLFFGIHQCSDSSCTLRWDALFDVNLSALNLLSLSIMVLFCRYIFIFSGMYQFRHFEVTAKRLGRIVLACLIASLFLLGAGSLTGIKKIEFGEALFFLAGIIIVFLVWRIIIYFLLIFVRASGRNMRHLVIIGLNDRSISTYRKLRQSNLGFNVLGYFDNFPQPRLKNAVETELPLLGSLESFFTYVSTNPVDYIVLTLPIRSHYDHIANIINFCSIQGIQTMLLTALFDLPPNISSRVTRLDRHTFINYFTEPQTDYYFVIKRLMDIMLSALALIILLPVFMIISLAIIMDDGFPVFFIQERVGLNKRRFKMLKFRTMIRNAEKMQGTLEDKNIAGGAAFKMHDDPRVTKCGGFLRRTSLDELPQFLNVFWGTMSLVGPRPLPMRDFERFYDDAHRLRFSVKPGITCMWQVSGRSDVDFEEWMKMDSFYVQNASMWLDITILLRTITAVLQKKGAY
ncbi:MAG: sugar transferase [Pseudomonadota bacterium]